MALSSINNASRVAGNNAPSHTPDADPSFGLGANGPAKSAISGGTSQAAFLARTTNGRMQQHFANVRPLSMATIDVPTESHVGSAPDIEKDVGQINALPVDTEQQQSVASRVVRTVLGSPSSFDPAIVGAAQNLAQRTAYAVGAALFPQQPAIAALWGKLDTQARLAVANG